MSAPHSHTGLTQAEAERLLETHGPNALPEHPPTPTWLRLLRQFQSPLIFILLFALIADAVAWWMEGAHGLPIESIAIGLILLLNACLGVYQESKSESALAKLQKLSTPFVWVYRDGHLQHLSSELLVPGDLVRVEAGNRIPADGKLITTEPVMLDESVLTGESLPVEKLAPEEVSSGTQLVRGLALLEVTRTGIHSSMGRLAAMIGAAKAEKTPLEKRLASFSHRLAYIVLALVLLIGIGGIAVEGWSQLGHIFLFAVALAVAAIPEGLPAVLTMTLALGVERMAHRKAVVRRLSAVEALGSVTVIATDKTGTLTENKMSVKELISIDEAAALKALVLANDADPSSGAGDPLELALLEFGSKSGLDPVALMNQCRRLDSIPFDSTYKYMQVTVEEQGRTLNYLKGAPEAVLGLASALSEAERLHWAEQGLNFAKQGYRVLALGDSEEDKSIRFLGLVMLWDPPRPEVPDAILKAQSAGIRIVMITGDHPATALAVGEAVNIHSPRVLTGQELDQLSPAEFASAAAEVNVFARVSPEHKLALVEALKARGEVVAMTGDGVNDAPALKRSDVGVAMGQRGSDITREVADLVLLDDNFATIVVAIEEGRNIYENIQKFIRFLFSTNLAELLIIVFGAFGAVMLGLRESAGTLLLPFTAVQLLWLNVLTDGPPALALGLDHNEKVMRNRPRDPRESLLDWTSLSFIFVTGGLVALIAGIGLVLLPAWGYSLEQTRTAVFLYTTLCQLLYAYSARKIGASPDRNNWLHLAVGLSLLLQVATVLVPWLRQLLGLTSVTPPLAGVICIALLATFAVAELYNNLIRAHRSHLAASAQLSNPDRS
ncbi:MAG: cation-translocating P-type ATPase [Planctomycetota bacterium]